MRRALSLALVVLALSAARAEAITAQDIIDLSRAGLGEEVLLALIEVDGSLFTIDAGTLKSLKAAGVSDRVIEAMIRSGRTRVDAAVPPPVPAGAPEPPEPQVIVIEHERPIVEQVAVPVPVYIPVYGGSRVRHKSGHVVSQPLDPSPGFGAVVTPPYQHTRPAKPVYWGWGGKLRPDAWKPAPDSRHAKTTTKARSGSPPDERR